MTREGQIKQAGQNYAKEWNWDLSVLIGFYKGVEWADRTMIERACEWLERHTPSNYTSNTITFVEQFKKDMEQ